MDFLRDWHEKFLEAKRLSEMKTDGDGDGDYRWKQRAKEILLELRAELEGQPKDVSNPDRKPSMSAFLTTVGQLGLVCLEMKEISEAEEYLMQVVGSSAEYELEPECIVLALEMRNHLGYVWSQRGEPEKAEKWLREAEELYSTFKRDGDKVPLLFGEVFEEGMSEAWKQLESVLTMTKFYLAQVYGMLKDFPKSAMYCHETLKRQLAQDYDPIEWAINSATLSTFFLERLLFKQARHHLAASSYVLDVHKGRIDGSDPSSAMPMMRQRELTHKSAELSRYWAKYGLALMERSVKRLNNTEEEEAAETSEELENLWFDGLDLSPYEKEITDSAVATFDDARELFLATQKHLNAAKDWYDFEAMASDHVEITQNHSRLFKLLAAFEPDDERQLKMMRKRAGMLEALAENLNPRYFLELLRELWFELGEIYHDMMQLKFEKVKKVMEVPTPQVLKKFNDLAEASIKYFNQFLDSLKDTKTKELPDPIPEEHLESALTAFFYLGRLYYKYVTADKKKQAENTEKAYESFKFLVDTCEKSEEARSIAGEELELSREMMTLLKMKALKL